MFSNSQILKSTIILFLIETTMLVIIYIYTFYLSLSLSKRFSISLKLPLCTKIRRSSYDLEISIENIFLYVYIINIIDNITRPVSIW